MNSVILTSVFFTGVAFLGIITFILIIWFSCWFAKQWKNYGVDQAKIQSELNVWKKELSIINEELKNPELRLSKKQELENEKIDVEKTIAKLQKSLSSGKKTF